MQLSERKLLLANGTLVDAEGDRATLVMPDHKLRADGFIET